MDATKVEIQVRSSLDDAAPLFQLVPELRPMSIALLKDRASRDPLLLVAEVDGRPAGFKLGYALSDTVFYSWIGGVAPEARRLGLGRRLLREQEQHVRCRGYATLRVKSMNQFPAMLALLISERYQITEVERDDVSEPPKIVFEKGL